MSWSTALNIRTTHTLSFKTLGIRQYCTWTYNPRWGSNLLALAGAQDLPFSFSLGPFCFCRDLGLRAIARAGAFPSCWGCRPVRAHASAQRFHLTPKHSFMRNSTTTYIWWGTELYISGNKQSGRCCFCQDGRGKPLRWLQAWPLLSSNILHGTLFLDERYKSLFPADNRIGDVVLERRGVQAQFYRDQQIFSKSRIKMRYLILNDRFHRVLKRNWFLSRNNQNEKEEKS